MPKAIDLTGRRFGRLEVVSEAERDKNGVRRWLCLCDCGNETTVYQGSLCRSSTKSCGCYLAEATKKRMSKGWNSIFTKEFLIREHKEKGRSLREIVKEHGCTLGCITRYMRKFAIEANDPFYNLEGQKIEMLEVVDLAYTKNGCSYWNVLCDCGNTKVVNGASLVRAKIVSCGCWNKDKNWQGVGDLSQSYWNKIVKGACRRGIEITTTIDEAWKQFEKQNQRCALTGVKITLDRSLKEGYRTRNIIQTASLDRIDSSKGYVLGNIQWVHKTLNKMKSDLVESDFIEWCGKVVSHRKVSECN